jgi:adenosylcobyric acid synthase
VYRATKTTTQVVARADAPSFLFNGEPITGYEIHSGEILHEGDGAPFRIVQRNSTGTDLAEGAVSSDGAVVGTMIHGILDNRAARASLLAHLRVSPATHNADPSSEYDRLADAVEGHLSMAALDRIIGIEGSHRP